MKHHQSGLTLIEILIVVVIVSIAAFIVFGGHFMRNDEDAKQTMIDAGYIDPQVVDSVVGFAAWRGCGDSDLIMYNVIATQPATKRQITAIVCVGMWKAPTIRYPRH